MRSAALALALAIPLVGCTSGDDDDSADDGTSALSVVTALRFAREAPDGFSTGGFDLDGLDSATGGSDGCGIGDLLHVVTEQPGIDNSFGSSLLPALENIGGGPLEDLIQNSILDGELLLMIELGGVDDPMNDDCVAVEVSRGIGPPMIGGDGAILPDQTYSRDPDKPTSSIACAVITNGVLRADPFSLRLPLNIFDEHVDITLLDGVLEVDLLGDGRIAGSIGGGVDIQSLKENVATLDGIGDQIPTLIGPLLDFNADLAPTNLGACTQLSVAITYEGVGAWFFE